MTERRHAQPREFVDALEGLDFPASKAAIQNKAHDKGGIDSEVNYILGMISDRTYDSMQDLQTEIEWVYENAGGLPDAAPAAASRMGQRGKDAVEANADTREGEPRT
jgi:hypothetical protein